jgi:hypothetical protein
MLGVSCFNRIYCQLEFSIRFIWRGLFKYVYQSGILSHFSVQLWDIFHKQNITLCSTDIALGAALPKK